MNSSKFLKSVSLVVVLLMAFSMAACSTAAQPVSSGPAGNTAAATSAPAGSVASSEPTAQTAESPLGKYDPEITVTTIRSDLGTNYKYDEGETIDNNLWTKLYKDKLGINLKYDWVVSGDQYTQKFAVAVASSALPDMFDVGSADLASLTENGMLADMTDAYGKYASADLKKINDDSDGFALKISTFDGKLMALPEQLSRVDNMTMMWIREDWLKKLNLQAPKTMDELLSVAKAFMEQDPDGNGKKDTVGFGINKDFVNSGVAGSVFDMAGLIYAYHAYPGGWIKGASDNLVYGTIQPEMKTALASLQQMFKDGLLDPEFAVKDTTKVQEDAAAGKFGITFGMMWNSIWPLQAAIDANPEAKFIPVQLVSADAQPALNLLGSPIGTWHVVNKACKNPEALVKMVNLWVDVMYGPDSKASVYGTTPAGKETFKMSMFREWTPTQNMDTYQHVVKALETGDTSVLIGRDPPFYELVKKWQAGDKTAYGNSLLFGPGGSQAICMDVYNNKSWVSNEFYGNPTPTMVDKNATLGKIQNEIFTKIIMGKVSVDEFDNYVSQWKKLGGDQITQEVNDWYATHK